MVKTSRPQKIYTTMVDKYEGKKYIAKEIGEQYIIPTIGVWESFDDIYFNELPNQFVLKIAHGSGGVVISQNKETFDYEMAKIKIENSLRTNFFGAGRE